MLVPTKPWYQSKGFWLGIAQAAVGLGELAIGYLESPEAGIGFIISGLATILVRYVTKKPVTFSGKEEKVVIE